MLRDPAADRANPHRAQRNGIDLDQRTYDVSEPVGSTQGFIHQAAVGMHVSPRGPALNGHTCATPWDLEVRALCRRVVARGGGGVEQKPPFCRIRF